MVTTCTKIDIKWANYLLNLKKILRKLAEGPQMDSCRTCPVRAESIESNVEPTYVIVKN